MIYYLGWKLLGFLADHLPVKVSYGIAVLIADSLYFLSSHWRRNLLEAMCLALNRPPRSKIVRLSARRAMRNHCKYMVDLLRLSVMDPRDLEQRVSIDGVQHVDQALKEGKGVILVGLHHGVPELAGAALARRHYEVSAVARTLGNRSMNKIITHIRTALGLSVIPVEQAQRKSLQALRQRHVLGLLLDIPQPTSWVEVRFLNTTVRVPAGAATLALRTGARVVPAFVVRLPDNRFLGLFKECVEFEPSGDIEQDVVDFTQTIMTSLEPIVSQFPDQWYPFSPIWSRRPL